MAASAKRSELEELANILHLVFHRNHNQHRQQLWWRDFAGFRRQLQQHLADTDIMDSKAAARGGKTALKKRCDERLVCWRDVLVSRWFLSFSQLIASTRFSAIGLVLMAILARVSLLLGITQQYEDLADAELRAALETFAQQDARSLFDSESGAAPSPSQAKAEDLGEVVTREGGPELAPSPAPTPASAPAPKPAKKKVKKRKGNAIDDLFAGL